ncbi:hypothetical protein VNO77_13338 [Canavalia gladiata]|uniref:Uncharacterized protein n=1 Tax=Canavalia gladiata TaxID=3824 RepID=A0AAN9LXS9_CANGL
MRAPTILRSLPLRPRTVTPLPESTRFDRELTAELRSQGITSGEIGLARLLDAAITTQKIALDFLVNISYRDDADRVAVDKYLEDNIEILDACNYFVDRMDTINEYVDSLRVAVHLLDRGNSVTKRNNDLAQTRALEVLESCQSMLKRCKAKESGGSCLKKMLRQKLCHETQLSEVMCGSKAMALMCCRFLELGLAFDSSKRGLPLMKLSHPTSCSWVRVLQELAKQAEGSGKKNRRGYWSSLLMAELQQTVTAARELKEQMKAKREKEIKFAVERLKISCKELEHGLEIVEERVKNLYKSLIHVRMTLLGILSQSI